MVYDHINFDFYEVKNMIKILEGIENVGDEVKCQECDSIIHCEEQDWGRINYIYRGELRINEAIDCPNCYCEIRRWEDT